MLNAADVIAFVSTAQAQAACAFYRDSLGLRLVADEPFALVFDAHGVMLRVTRVDTVVPAPYTVLGWRVPDIGAAVVELGARGVAFERYPGMPQDELGIWTSPGGARIAWFRDPDGNVLSLTQF
ncbi:MAG TPA: VOC family protein [Longimicrobium sp.]|jgi:catechol 2,3-dioxygenase-like lactoylglutathione lyase family enzyme|nr:VOC family protein [Longimicrobium sp.]